MNDLEQLNDEAVRVVERVAETAYGFARKAARTERDLFWRATSASYAEVRARLLKLRRAASLLTRRCERLSEVIAACDRAEAALPTTEAVTGSDPDFTGGLSTEAYLDRIRGRTAGREPQEPQEGAA